MTIYEFLDLLIDNTETEIYSFEHGDTIASGESDDIKDGKYADYEIASFEIYDGKLIINID